MSDKRLLTYLLRHCLAGIIAGWLVLAGLIVTDVGRLGSLLSRSDYWVEALILMIVFFAITFGSLAMGSAVMLLHDRGPGKKKRARKTRNSPVGPLQPQSLRCLPPRQD